MTTVPTDLARRAAVMLALAVVVVSVVIVRAGPAGAASDSFRSRQWALDVIGADRAHEVGRGDGVVIAVVDTGVDLSHPDLAANLVPGRDVVDDDGDPQDENGHGTHVAGIAAAEADNGRGVASTAPDAAIMPVRALGADGSGSGADVQEGIRWAADNGADVINLSLAQAGQQVFGPGFAEAVSYAWDRGVVVVVAAGNEYVLSSGFEDEPALVVAATTREDRSPDYSNGVGNARWAIAAPGGGCTLLTCPTEDSVFSTYWDDEQGSAYAYLSGTSMAAPHVAGAAAVLRGLGFGPRETVDRLLATAEDLGSEGRDGTYGEGRLDLGAATAGLGSTTTPEPSPSPAADPEPSASTPVASPPADPGAEGAPAEPDQPASTATPSAPASPSPTDGDPSPSASPPARSPRPPPDADDLGSGAEAESRAAGGDAEGGDDRSGLVAIAFGLLLLAGGAAAWSARDGLTRPG